jgi:cyanophycin synthetase
LNNSKPPPQALCATNVVCGSWAKRVIEAPGVADAAQPTYGFEDSRRLTGANRWFAGTAVTLTPLGTCAADSVAHSRWCARVAQLYALLGWPAPNPQVLRHSSGTLLVCAAPAHALFTATEVGEWAWEQELAAASGTGHNTGFDTAHPFDTGTAATVFAQRAAAEFNPALAALSSAAHSHGALLLVDDDSLSLGAGSSCQTWPLAALPTPAAVPWATLHRVPTALITGSNGKTTTVRLLAAMATAAELTPGFSSTEGLWIGSTAAGVGDYAGPAGARAVLRHPDVQVALLETARGGLLRRGLAVPQADVAVVTNVSEDHLGEYGIDSTADIAEVKLVVAHALAGGAHHPAGTLVLNADDHTLMATAARLPHAAQAKQALFATDHNHPALVALRSLGGSTCGVQSQGQAHGKKTGHALLHHQGLTTDMGDTAGWPITLGGAAPHNTANALAAALAAVALGLPVTAVLHTLQHFGARPQDNPGRLERWLYQGATVLVDYAHNPEGLAQLLAVATSLRTPGARLGLLLGQAGNRSNAAIAELAQVAARFAPDHVVIKELPAMLRGRPIGEVPALLHHGLLAAGLPAAHVAHQSDELAAAQQLLAWAQAGDVVVLAVHGAGARSQLGAWLVAG